MSLVRRSRNELDWPSWFGRSLLDRPFPELTESWKELMSEAEMKLEEFEEDGTLVVRAEMPGIDPDRDVEITLTDGTLHLRAQRRSESKTEDKKGYRSEFSYGSFSRSLRLPAGATEDDVKATYCDGILEVRIPVDDSRAAARKVPVARG